MRERIWGYGVRRAYARARAEAGRGRARGAWQSAFVRNLATSIYRRADVGRQMPAAALAVALAGRRTERSVQ